MQVTASSLKFLYGSVIFILDYISKAANICQCNFIISECLCKTGAESGRINALTNISCFLAVGDEE